MTLKFTMAALLALTLTGCSVFTGSDEAARAEAAAQQTAAPDPVKAGEKMLGRILDGMSKKDYTLFSTDFTREMRDRFPGSNFTVVNDTLGKSLGDCQSRQFLGALKWGELDVLLWKARFSVPANDILIMMNIGMVDNSYKVFSFSFQGQVNVFDQEKK